METQLATEEAAGDFTSSLGCLVRPALAGLAAQLSSIPGLGDSERAVILAGAASGMYEAAHRKACRVLLLELNAARLSGKLAAADSAARWREFLELSGTERYWESLGEHYPTLLPRLRALLARRCAAAGAMAGRLAADRSALAGLLGDPAGELVEARFGAGDTHRGGQSVTVLRWTAGQVVYKPRSVLVDRVLGDFLTALPGDAVAGATIAVPRVVPRSGYGWAEFIAHRYCAGAAELASFYRGIGHWLAVMLLLGGSDLHQENVIASGPVPVVIDCETLFAPKPPARPSGLGLAVDQAGALVGSTVLRTGMLPSRGVALGWRGVDISAAGSLPGQQPTVEIPVIVDAGSDTARMGYAPALLLPPASHPSPDPTLATHWSRVLDGFSELTAGLRAMDRAGTLEPLVRRFADCPVRVVLRSTEAYAELARMLWHPVSLHDQAAAAGRAAGLLSDMAAVTPGAPADPSVIAAEIADLLAGDIPFFETTPRRGSLTGPGGTTWLPAQDVLSATLARWRDADLELDRQVIRASLVCAYLNESPPEEIQSKGLTPSRPRVAGLDRRRRELAAAVIRRLGQAAVRGEDSTVTWIGPVLLPTGWAVEPLSTDSTYAGLAGLAVLLAAYQREEVAGRADEVDETGPMLAATLRTMRAIEDYVIRRRAQVQVRPPAVGGYVGLGSQIWAWLTLYRWGVAPDGLDRARVLATQVPAAAAASESYDLLTGMAGAIVPLLWLSEVASEQQWQAAATAIGDQLAQAATRNGGTACWPSARWPDGIGGFAHGVSGIGWALARLALATGQPAAKEAAQAAFAFEESLYDPGIGGWLDLRDATRQSAVAAWCHGSAGIGLSALDLAARGWQVPRDLLDRAVSSTDRYGLGWNHTLCHGDVGAWELLDAALTSGAGPAGAQRRHLAARVISSIERNGPVTGLSRDTFTPGLMPGLGGIGYQLLRLHEASDLPSVLIQG